MDMSDASATMASEAWLQAFNQALRQGDPQALAGLLSEDGHFRDLFALGWDIRSLSGRAALAQAFAQGQAQHQIAQVRLAAGRTPPRRVHRAGRAVIEAMVDFQTRFGLGAGVLRLVEDAGGPGGVRAWILMLGLRSLHGHAEGVQAQARDWLARDFGGPNWEDRRQRAARFEDRDPAVLVVGAGQAGLSIAARLGQLGVDTLVIDREQRIGDNWRRRYHALTLHNEVHVNHLPYMPFPPTWPVFIPKDKLANWFEAYVDSLDLRVWTGTELVSGEREAGGGAGPAKELGGAADHRGWRVELARSDGSRRTMRVRHIVFASGVSAIPLMPDQPGLKDFRGKVMHSGSYTEGSAWKGRQALVLGTGNSGHDVAQDLHAAGAQVTMIQRSPTHVVSLREAQRVYAIYTEGMPTDDCDLLATALPYPVLRHAYQMSTEVSRQADQAMLEGLAARGFQLTQGEDATGFQMMYLRRGGGYYFNVGCSDRIIDGSIGLIQHAQIDRFVADGVRLKDGRLMPADLLVMATGYANPQETVRRSLGDAVADSIGPVWGFDAGGELRNMWRPTAQPGIWFLAGSLAQCRIWSRMLAMQIKARELGLVDEAAAPGGAGQPLSSTTHSTSRAPS